MSELKRPLRVRAGGVLCDAWLPSRGGARPAVILLLGLPSTPCSSTASRFGTLLAARGFIAIAPRYRGTWESDGEFLEQSPVRDIAAVIALLARGRFTDLVTDSTVRFRTTHVSLLGSSFGGYVALAALKELRGVRRAVLLAPVISMGELGTNPAWKEERNSEHARMLRRAWPNTYRFSMRNYARLARDELVPSGYANLTALQHKSILVFHGRNDDVVSVHRTRRFVRETRAAGVSVEYREVRQGHHLRLRKAHAERVVQFLR